MSYVSLHNHSCHSILDGYQTVHEMVSRAKSLGQTAISVTDHGTMSGIIEFYNECNAQSVKPLLGCEFYFCPDTSLRDRKFTHHLVLIAMNDTGYMNLKTLDTIAYNEENMFYKPRIDEEILRQHSDGIICLSACMASIVNTENGEEWFCKFKEIFGDRFYAEIQPLNIEEQWAYNEKVIGLARKYSVPLVVTTDAHFATPADEPYHQHWVRVHNKQGYHDDENYVWSEQELRDTQWIPQEVKDEAIANTQIIADRCNVTIAFGENHYPKYPVDNPVEKVREICRENWKSRVPAGRYKEYGERFNAEMVDLEATDYLNYMLIVWDFLNWCRERSIPIGKGRGSSGGCLVGYVMGIHEIDPLIHHTEFFRFCNPQRITMPDIDTDVSQEHRQEVIDYVSERYGNVAKVMTFGYTANPEKDSLGKKAVKTAAQALDIKASLIDEINKQVKDDIAEIIDIPSELTIEQRKELVDISKHFFGRIVQRGVHASAVLVTPDSLLNYCPVEGANSSSGGERHYERMAAYDFHQIEAMGVMKLDVLGLVSLDVIDNCKKYIGHDVDIPMDDAETYKMYADGNVSGIFQMESPGMRRTAMELGVSCFDDIAATIALFRPGPIDSGYLQKFIDSKHSGNTEYPCDAMKEVAGNTYGVLVYQEQIMKIAMKMAGYNLGQADALRKVIGRKEMTKIDAAVKDFVDSSVTNGYSQEAAESVGLQIKTAGRYVFNLAHSVEYSVLSYETAYLKCHYPVQFLCAIMNSKGDQEKVLPYIEECHRLSIEILPPDYSIGNRDWTVEGNAIRCGLCYIKGVGKNLTVKPTQSWSALVAMNNKRVTENLIKAGALDYIGRSRGWMLSNLEDAQATLKRKAQCEDRIAINEQALANATTDKERAKYTRQLTQWKAKLDAAVFTETAEANYDATAGEIEVLSFSFNALPKVLCGIAKRVTEFNDKNGHAMARIAFSTKYGEFEGVVFASAWKKAKYRDRYRGWCEGITVEQGKTYEFIMKKGVFIDVRESA